MHAIRLALPLKLLLAVDDSAHSEAALNLLTRITWPSATSAHILALVSGRLPRMEGRPAAPGQVEEALELFRWRRWAAATALTNQAAGQLQAHQVRVETEVGEGPPAQALLNRAAALPADLIVLGARGVSPSSKGRLSPTVHKVTHFSDASVLVARPSPQIRPLNTLVAVNASAQAWRAIEFLSTLALPQWATVTVVNVVGPDSQAASPSFAPSLAGCPQRPEPAERLITRAIEHFHDWGVQIRSQIRVGQPAAEILALAQEQTADLIVIGAQRPSQAGPSGWDGITQQLVKYAPCSVLVVRGELEQPEPPPPDFEADVMGRGDRSPAVQKEGPVKVPA